MPANEPPRANFAFPTRYLLGCGRRTELAREAAGLGIRCALVVTDRGVADQPWFEDLCRAARDAGLRLHVSTEVRSNPVEANVTAGVERHREGDCDGVVAVGGGSCIDTAKAIALMTGHDGSVLDYEFRGRKTRPIDAANVAPLLAVPSTAGSGSELSTGTVVTDREAGVKRTLLHPALMPKTVIADPETTFALPAELTAATGMDALTHAFEAYCAPGYHPMADAIALESLRLINTYLPDCYRTPDDAIARTNMMTAASMAAVAFQKGLGLVHAMVHPLGAVTDIHHGLGNGILLPHVMRHNRDHMFMRMPRLARALGLYGHGFDAIIDWILDLRAALDIPDTLEAAGVAREGLAEELAPKVLEERVYLATNPAPVTEAEIAALYRAAGAS